MYDIISNIVNHTSDTSAEYFYYSVCGTLIILFSVVFIDLIYRLFRNLWR